MTRNKYIDGDPKVANQLGCDIVQLKFDGWFCKAVSVSGLIEYFSDTDRKFAEEIHSGTPDGVYFGEYMRGTQWSKDPARQGKFFVFDLVERNGLPFDNPYKQRYACLRYWLEHCPRTWKAVSCYHINDQPSVWSGFVESQGYEGLVYRQSSGLPGAPIVRHKKTLTLDGVVIGVIPGEGKHLGRMGSVKVQLGNGAITSIGNGWSDPDREQPEAFFLGRTLEFETNAVFESGNVRHGRFVRWRDDRPNTPSTPLSSLPPTESS